MASVSLQELQSIVPSFYNPPSPPSEFYHVQPHLAFVTTLRKRLDNIVGKRETTDDQDFPLFMPPYQKIGGHIVLPLSGYLSVHLSVCLHKLNVKT